MTGSPRIAMLMEHQHNDHEVWYPLYRFQEAGASVAVVGPETGRYLSKLGQPITAEIAAADADPDQFDGVVIPGGYAPDMMRLCRPMVDFVRHVHERGALVAAICHGSWLLASADIIRGRKVTGAPSIADDLRNAGGVFVDDIVVRDGNIVTSRKPADLPDFSRTMLFVLDANRHNKVGVA